LQLQRTKVSAAGIAELKKVLPNDHLGSDGVTALTNGNYVVTAANSLVGSTASDNVGSGSENVKALTNGNYVVTSTSWDNGVLVDVGAVT